MPRYATVLIAFGIILVSAASTVLTLSLFDPKTAPDTSVATQSEQNVAPKPSAPALTIESVRAFDSANTINDPEWFKKAYDAGFRLYILHSTAWGTCNTWERTQLQAQMALDAGLAIAAYTRNPRCFEGGIKALGPLQNKLQFFALDIETDPGIPVTREMVDGIKALGVRPVIYSGAKMWPKIMNNSKSFSDVPLWDTETSTFNLEDWTANVLAPTPNQYGGWNTPTTMRIATQQHFEYTLNGINVDLNSFSASFIETK